MAKEQELIEDIIDGMRYSTANAIQICPRHKDGYGDPIAGLYRTAKGNLFVVEGSPYKIVTATMAEALGWMKLNGMEDMIEDVLGKYIEDA
jgi:hypothetical protein